MVELLVILVLMGLVVSIVIPNIGKALDKIKFRADLKKITWLVHKAKFSSFYYQSEVRLFEADGRLAVTGMDLEAGEIPPLRVSVPREIRFRPNGLCSGGEIRVSDGDRPRAVIKASEFAGMIEVVL